MFRALVAVSPWARLAVSISISFAVAAPVLLLACGDDSSAADNDAASIDDGGDGRVDGGAPDAGIPPVEVAWEDDFTLPPTDDEGWSVLTPSADSLLVYVSASLGNDDSGQVYTPSAPEIGADPRLPSGAVQAFATIDAALAQTRDGYPDWVLLRRGDTWERTSSLDSKSGRAADERFVLTSYGPETARPLIRTGTGDGLHFTDDRRYAAAVGLEFYAHHRDPDGADFVGFDNVSNARGFWIWSGGDAPNTTILIEDCVFRFYSNNVVQGPLSTQDVVVRRCQLLNDYSTSSHSQGMYTSDASILLEENLFDHNGWYKQSYVALNDQAEGQATYFNHNTYFTNTHQTIFRRNLFLRASSIGNKFTANPTGATDEIMARDILLDNNLYVEGEIGVSAGGNTDNGDGSRFQNVLIANNVLLAIGRGRPTARSLGWGIDVIDWDGGRVFGNYLVHYGNEDVTNIYALKVLGHSRNVDIADNVIYGLDSTHFAIGIDGDPKDGLSVTGNQLQLQGTAMGLIDSDVAASGTFADNVYATDRSPADTHFRLLDTDLDFAAWVAQTGETGATFETLAYPAPDRTLESYMESLGQPGTLEAFLAEARKQAPGNWRAAYTAAAVNAYVRAGFAQ